MKKSIWIPMLLTVVLQADAPRIDRVTGLVVDKGLEDIKENCTVCHPGGFIVVNGGDRKFWRYKISVMQRGFGLWDLPEDTKARIVDYLSRNYAQKRNVSIDR
ncbi:MAG TPA: hypothetical protein ENK93_00565 [Campylobacteraceae bacterium]|nr:hypothetical protein [Campylobacteraceae bacterium]